VGLYPWNRERDVELARVNVGTGAPSDGVADQSRSAMAVGIRQAHDQRAAEKQKMGCGAAAVKRANL